VFFNRFGPASDPYLRPSCTPARTTPIASFESPPVSRPTAVRRRRLAALGLAVAFASPLLPGLGTCLYAQQVEEPAEQGAAPNDATEAPAVSSDVAPTAAVPAPLAGQRVEVGIGRGAVSSSADREAANEQLIDQALGQLEQGKYEAAEETLGQVKTVALPDARRKQVIEARAQAEKGTDQTRTARTQFDMGEQALAAGRVVEATQHFQTVANNGYAEPSLRQKAQEQIAAAGSAAKAAPTKADKTAAGGGRTLTAKQHYTLARERYAKRDWDAARQHFAAARELGYKAGLFEDSPQTYLARMDKSQQALAARTKRDAAREAALQTARDRAASGQGRREPVTLAFQANGNGQSQNGAGDPQLQEDLRETAVMQEVQRRQNMAESRRLVQEGRAAQDQGDTATARDRYQRALALDPTNAQANQGYNEVLRLRGELPGGQAQNGGGLATRAEAEIQAARTEIGYRFDDAIRRSQRAAVNISNLDQPFRDTDLLEGRRALEEAAVARNSNPTIFTDAELRTMDTRLAEARVSLNTAEQRRQDYLVTTQRREEMQRFEETQRAVRRERERTIADLIRTSRELSNRHEYEEALALIDQILELDPRNDYAIGVRPLIQDAMHFAEQRKWRERYQEEFVSTINSTEEKKIPYNDILNYPDDWPDISAMRDRTVAEERGEGAADQAVMAQLDRPLPELNFDAVAFGDVVDFLRDVSGANIFVNWKALETAGVDRTAPVTARLRNIRFSKALTIILDSVSGGTVPLGYTIDDGVITISTGEDLDRNTITRVYDIRDLIIDIPDFTDAPDFSLQSTTQQGQAGGGGGGGGGQGLFQNSQDRSQELDEGRTRQEMIDEIIQLITETVSPDSWRDAGGTTGSVRELQGQLIVTQTPENQRQLVALLAQLRETRAIQVTIEARFLTVSRNFMEDIGIDADFAFNIRNNGRRTWSPILINQDNTFTATPSTGVPGSIASTLDTSVPAFSTAATYLDDFQVNLLLRATQAARNASIVTAPRVTLFNGQRSYVLVATQRAYISDLNAQVGTGVGIFDPEIGTVQSGVLLDVSATVSADRKYVMMTLRPQLAQLLNLAEFTFQVGAAGTGIDPNNPFIGNAGVPTGIIQQPELQITEVRTTVSVPDGGTLLLGGQTIAGEIEVEQGVPVLSKIPFLKRLFTNRSRAKDEQVLLIMVKPTIIIQREIEAAQFPLLSNRANTSGGSAAGPAQGMRGLNQ
jgi:Flp pilus assembly secretin CpaC